MSKIAQKLEMNTKDLIRLNPDVVTEPKANSFIVVPEKKLNDYLNAPKDQNTSEVITDSISETIDLNEEEKLLEELKEKFVIYEVKKGDTFYSLNKKFEVTRGELLLLNPELTEGLKVGMILKIKEIIPEIVTDEVYYDDYIDYDKNLKAALLLPFIAEKYQNDTLTLKEMFAQNATLVNIATDFYLGAEIAVDSLRNKGIDIELNVYDTGNRRANEVANIISEKDLNNNDVVIGPLYSEEVRTVARNVKIPVVFPVYSKNQSEFRDTNIVKTSPDKNVFREELERYIKENFDGGNIIIVSDHKSESIQTSRSIQSNLNRDASSVVNILTPTNGYIEKSLFLELLKPNTKNWVIIATNNDIIVADAINSLISLPEETTVKVFTFDKGKAYDKVDNRKLAKIGFTFVSEDFVDENAISSKIFRSQYLRKNKALPSFYATKGFDITYDILIRLASGKDLEKTFKDGMSMRVETKFDYRNSGRIPENKGLFIIQYNEDLTLTKLK